ncbi:MAG: SAM-dependent methyltransferase [Oligoflexia bacterium]|nr:SAM-dependent methyltransferase [Oligoflexia bacterium]
MTAQITEFIKHFKSAIEGSSFVKLHLGAYRGSEELRRILVRPVIVRDTPLFAVCYQYQRKDIHKNIDEPQIVQLLQEKLGKDFFQATLYSTEADLSLELQNGKARLKSSAASFSDLPSSAHDRQKNRCVPEDAPFLKVLDISDARGRIRPQRYDKYRQIDKFGEILLSVMPNSAPKSGQALRVVDYGSGKNYLTFATHFLLNQRMGVSVEVVGVERRSDLAEAGQQVAQELGCAGLRFECGSILERQDLGADVVIALHACDTATDDALLAAVRARAALIVVAPCCHKYVRQNISLVEPHSELFKHGILEERLCTLLTDGLRALALEACGYQAKVFEFISSDHTDKNVMLTAQRGNSQKQRDQARMKMDEILKLWGLPDFYLDRVLTQYGAWPDA